MPYPVPISPPIAQLALPQPTPHGIVVDNDRPQVAPSLVRNLQSGYVTAELLPVEWSSSLQRAAPSQQVREVPASQPLPKHLTEAAYLGTLQAIGYAVVYAQIDSIQLDAQASPSPDFRFPIFDPTTIPGSPPLGMPSPAPRDSPPPSDDMSDDVSEPATNAAGMIDLTADRQDYDSNRRIFTAEGNVRMIFRGAVLQADRLKVNLVNRFVVAEGNVVLARGEQVVEGDRFDYDLLQESGVVRNAKGEIFLPTSSQDLTIQPASDAPSIVPLPRPLGDQLAGNQPLQSVSSPGGLNIVLGAETILPGGQLGGGELRRFRFEADEITFTPTQWFGTNVRITNDPFSPPQLEIRADDAKYTILSPELRSIETSSPRLVLDQALTIPIPRSGALLRENELEQAIVTLGIDGRDRDGLFIERGFPIISGERARLSITPQLLVNRGLNTGFSNLADSFGLVANLDARLSPRTSLTGIASFGGLDLSKVDSRLRASLRLRQQIGTHTLSVEGSYRDRLFNGSLGFQDVQVSLGTVLASPIIPLGDSGINLTYQVGGQYIIADTDRANLLAPVRFNNRVGLGRLQASASLSRGFILWQGEALPATPTEGLRYTPNPIVPYVQLVTGITGISSFYTTGNTQATLTGSVSLQAQFGQFSRPAFDYTGLNIGYSQTLRSGDSPFLFDRAVDNRVLSGGILQQIYGPVRFGVQTSINLDTSREISTDYILDYSRRAYGVTLRYNPTLQLGSINLRISDFNWTGRTEPFDGRD